MGPNQPFAPKLGSQSNVSPTLGNRGLARLGGEQLFGNSRVTPGTPPCRRTSICSWRSAHNTQCCTIAPSAIGQIGPEFGRIPAAWGAEPEFSWNAGCATSRRLQDGVWSNPRLERGRIFDRSRLRSILCLHGARQGRPRHAEARTTCRSASRSGMLMLVRCTALPGRSCDVDELVFFVARCACGGRSGWCSVALALCSRLTESRFYVGAVRAVVPWGRYHMRRWILSFSYMRLLRRTPLCSEVRPTTTEKRKTSS